MRFNRSGPLLARALVPEGRGDLAAILLPITLAPVLFGLGLGTFVTRETARGRPLSVLLGSVGPLIINVICGSDFAAGESCS